jgi:hyperosmotically inducible protein
MKTRILKLTAILGVLAVASACSATRTQQSAGEVVDDSVLTSKVKMALIEDPVTKAGDLHLAPGERKRHQQQRGRMESRSF